MHFSQAPAHAAACRQMIETQLQPRGIHDPRVLEAMATVPRHAFVADTFQRRAYDDCALPSAAGQTISQPYIVAIMSQLLQVRGGEQVFEIGTGTGYQAAVLAYMVGERGHVYSIERLPELSDFAAKMLRWLNISNVTLQVGDGSAGWPEAKRFDRIIITAGAPHVPEPVQQQLADGGVLVAPIGDESLQQMVRITRHGNELREERFLDCRFVPLVGQYGWVTT